MRGLSPVVASGGHSSSRCAGLSLSRPLPLRSTGSRRAGSVVVAHGPSCSAACGILPDQGSNPCPLHRQANSQSLRHQGSPTPFFNGMRWSLNSLAKKSWPYSIWLTYLFHFHLWSDHSYILPTLRIQLFPKSVTPFHSSRPLHMLHLLPRIHSTKFLFLVHAFKTNHKYSLICDCSRQLTSFFSGVIMLLHWIWLMLYINPWHWDVESL